MIALRPIADSGEVLAMMEDFNRHEQIPWKPVEMGAALGRLCADASIGIARVIIEGDAIVGYLLVTFGFDIEFGGRDAFLTELYVRPEARGRKIAEAALALVEVEAKNAGVGALHLQVRPDNKSARAVYERRGFTQIPRLILSKNL